MRTIGLLGGMSWESTVPYYRIINQNVARELRGLHSARIILWSVDFHDIELRQREERWSEAGELLAEAAVRVEGAGADLLVLCTNTMHRVASQIEARITIPFLHIVDPTARALLAAGISTVGLLGTRFTMEQRFYRDRLEKRFGLVVRTPRRDARRLVDRVIYEELCRGVVAEASRQELVDVVDELAASGCEAIILGCTEIGLLLRPEDVRLPLFDTTRLHAEAAAARAVGEAAGRGGVEGPRPGS